MDGSRRFDLALFGATGFTGGLTADYLAAHSPAEMRWALVGRNRSKLEAVAARLAAAAPQAPVPEIVEADAGDATAMRKVAESTRVVVTTVGPYVTYGGPLVAACAAAGTDYCDLTGEPEFVDRAWIEHRAEAERTGARIVHCCGFDSIPHDLGAYFTVQQLPEGVPIKLEGFVRGGGTLSGGTLESAVTAFSRVRQLAEASGERRKLEPRSDVRRVRGVRGIPKRQGSIGGWALPMLTIDPLIVVRSARALDRYGPDFSYSHYLVLKRLPVALGLPVGMAGLFALAQVPPARKWLMGRRKPGEGPSPEQRAKAWFKVRFEGEGGGRRAVTEVSGGDPGYGETAKMVSEAALCLAQDELPASAGQVTTAIAMGDALTDRLRRAGIGFEVLEKS